jgi:hypothetical protein
MLNLMKQIWRRWKKLAHLIVDAQNAVLLTLVFILGVAPTFLLTRLTRKRLLDRGEAPGDVESHWHPVKGLKRDLDWAQRPW